MASINKVILIGNLTKDVEARYSPHGQAVASATIACNDEWKDKATGEKKSRVEYVNLTFFGRTAEIAAEYLKKGASIYVEGSLRTEKYQDKSTGQDKYSTKVIVNDMKMLGGKKEAAPKPVVANEVPKQKQDNWNGIPTGGGNPFNDNLPF
jgi:single-strand DNA-binding protein